MQLDESQRATLAAHIIANPDPAVIAALAIRDDNTIHAAYNAEAGFIVWRNNISPEEYREVLVWTEVDTMGAGNARIWEWITGGMTYPIDATKANVRQGIADAWPNNTATRDELLAIAKRDATLAEMIFASGAGTNGSPGTLTLFGEVSVSDIGRALNEAAG